MVDGIYFKKRQPKHPLFPSSISGPTDFNLCALLGNSAVRSRRAVYFTQNISAYKAVSFNSSQARRTASIQPIEWLHRSTVGRAP